MKINTHVSRLFIGAFCSLALHPVPAAQPPLVWQTTATSVALQAGGRPVWQFNYGTNAASKPFFHPLALPGGEPLTWASPSDHVWHYGHWFSWKYLNKVNYWEENKQRQSDGVTDWKVVKIETRTDFSARIELAIDYRARGAAQSVLTERRLIQVSAPAADGSYHLDWQQAFKAGATNVVFDRTPLLGEPGGQTWGGYAGLSLRFAKEFADCRVQATAETGDATENRYRFSAAGADYNGRIGGSETGVAFLDHPSNLRHPSRWYAIVDPKQPFGFLNAAFVQQQPFTLPAGESFTLRYRVLVHPGRWDGARLEAEIRKFQAAR